MEAGDRHDEMLMGLVYRARWDEEFRRAAHRNPDAALAEYSYRLTEAEMAAVMGFYQQVKDLSDRELNDELASRADPISAMGADGV